MSGGAEITPPQRPLKKRSNPDRERIAELEEANRLIRAQLHSALQHLDGVNAIVEMKDQKFLQIRIERDELKERVGKLEQRITDLKRRRLCLSYDDLSPGGVLKEDVSNFTYFPDKECNDAFLE